MSDTAQSYPNQWQPLFGPTGRLVVCVAVVTLVLWLIAAWLTHVVVCIYTSQWLLLIAGTILLPIAWVHGTGVWFGLF